MYEKLQTNTLDILSKIEKNLSPDCELLIRTNHDMDGLSGIPKEKGKWYVHLMASTGHKSKGNVEHKSLYLNYGDDLFQLLHEVETVADKYLSEYYISITEKFCPVKGKT